MSEIPYYDEDETLPASLQNTPPCDHTSKGVISTKIVPDFYPLTRGDVQQLLYAVHTSKNFEMIPLVIGRLIRAIPHMTCPEPFDVQTRGKIVRLQSLVIRYHATPDPAIADIIFSILEL